MDETKIETPNSQNGENGSEESLESLKPSEELGVFQSEEEYQAELQRISELNKKLYARATKAEKKAKEKPQQTPPKTETPKVEPQENINQKMLDERLDRLELTQQGYSPDEIEFIMRYGGKQVIEDPIVKAAIQTIRDQKKSEAATPEGSGGSPIFQKHTTDQLKNMTSEQLEKILPRAY